MKERETAKIEIDRVERDIASLDFPFAYVAKKHFFILSFSVFSLLDQRRGQCDQKKLPNLYKSCLK